MNLSDLIDLDELRRHIGNGYINVQRHPTEPLRIFNYSHACQYDQAWDPVTRACRGLIVDDDGTVVARPFPKFFNLSEHGTDSHAGPLHLEAPITVYDKADGSLGIAYRRSDGGIAWATRGSFTSPQALWATAFWNRHANEMDLNIEEYTFLAEIIYPDNRIVVDYGDTETLMFTAVLRKGTGEQVSDYWIDTAGLGPFFRRVASFGLVSDPGDVDPNDRPDAEGYVLLSADRKTRVKVKADEYLRLHRLLTGVSSVTIWDLLRNGQSIRELIEVVPDEFATWVKKTVADLLETHVKHQHRAREAYDTHRHLLPDRKAFALEVLKDPDTKSLVFALADGKDITDAIWKQIKPERTLPFTDTQETA